MIGRLLVGLGGVLLAHAIHGVIDRAVARGELVEAQASLIAALDSDTEDMAMSNARTGVRRAHDAVEAIPPAGWLVLYALLGLGMLSLGSWMVRLFRARFESIASSAGSGSLQAPRGSGDDSARAT